MTKQLFQWSLQIDVLSFTLLRLLYLEGKSFLSQTTRNLLSLKHCCLINLTSMLFARLPLTLQDQSQPIPPVSANKNLMSPFMLRLLQFLHINLLNCPLKLPRAQKAICMSSIGNKQTILHCPPT